jgi:hypothetical protein
VRRIRAVLKDKGQTVHAAANVRQALERYQPLPGARRAGHELPPLTVDGVIAGSPMASPSGQRHRRGLGVLCAAHAAAAARRHGRAGVGSQ